MFTLEKKIISLDEAKAQSEKVRSAGKTIVTTNGCFDILHWGHIKYLAQAKELGDVLVCGLNSDSSVKKLKGDGRPIFAEKIRALQLAALVSVDFVVVFNESTPVEFMRAIRPNLHVKGADYENKKIPESEVISEWGGKLAFLKFVDGFSTSSILEKLNQL